MISYNKQHYIKDGKAWFPIMGEYQYSRQDKRFWSDGLSKMKACGVDVVASYVIWLHHEEIEGVFKFDGNHSLRDFIKEVKKQGMLFCLRIGPWIHGEVRNGGFPDWIYTKNCVLRSNDEKYLYYVERYFKRLYKECEGLFYEDGGPIFSIQVENEYSQWGFQSETVGDVHINKLIDMLNQIGYKVPVYYATGWGKAAVGKALSVWGGYPEAPWEHDNGELEPMGAYVISFNPNDAHIGSDTGTKNIAEDVRDYPYPFSTVELGGGIQVTKVRRPVVENGKEIGAVALSKLASGAGSLGYYVFGGGFNPVGKLSTFQEYRVEEPIVSGFCCDLPEINYDFQAPLSQYGSYGVGYKDLKLINTFVKEFETKLCTSKTVINSDNAVSPLDLTSPRYSYRELTSGGKFLFFNNFVRRYNLPSREFKVTLDNGKTQTLSLKNGDYGWFPINFNLDGGGVIRFTNTCPLMKVNGDYVFYAVNNEPYFVADAEDLQGFNKNIILISRNDALNAFKFNYQGKERLIITNAEIFERNGELVLQATSVPYLKVYPALDKAPNGFTKIGEEQGFEVYSRNDNFSLEISAEKVAETSEFLEYSLNVLGDNSAFITIDYAGDSLDLFANGKKVNDHFYTGVPFKVGLSHHGKEGLSFKIYPHFDSDFKYLQYPLKTQNGKALKLNKVTAVKLIEYVL
ncbi:MAG: beta-galactosidase [Clostridia bacterium]|nr:beta-galactosidase [Clostridia bacterium]